MVSLVVLIVVVFRLSRLMFVKKPEQHFGDEIKVEGISGSSGVALGRGANVAVHDNDLGGGDYAEGDIGQREGSVANQLSGPAIRAMERGSTQLTGGSLAPAAADTLLAHALEEVRSSAHIARAQGRTTLAEDFDEITTNLEAALHAEAAGDRVRRSKKLERARADLQKLAQRHPDLGPLAALITEVKKY